MVRWLRIGFYSGTLSNYDWENIEQIESKQSGRKVSIHFL